MNVAGKHRSTIIAGLGLLCLTLTAYWPLRYSEFTNYDDNLYVTENPHVRAGLSLEGARWAFESVHASNWHPLTWLSHMLDCQLFGLDAPAHHMVNLALHTANAFLLLGFLWRTTRAFWPGIVVAGLFALHPVQVESVAWVAERKNLLSTLFFLLTLLTYAQYTGTRSRRYYVLCLVFFSLGLMSKPMLVTLPCLLLLLDYWPLGRLHLPRRSPETTPPILDALIVLQQLLWEKVPFFVLALGSSIVTVMAQIQGGAMAPLEIIPIGTRFANAVVSYLRYAGKLGWPEGLAVPYPYPPGWPSWVTSAALIFVIGLSLAAIKLLRRAPYVAVGWFWFLGTLVPVIGLVQVGEQALADRYLYIPSTGLFVAAVWAAWEKCAGQRFAPGTLSVTVAGVMCACVIATRTQVGYWRNSISLFEHTVAATPNNASAYSLLGSSYNEKNRLSEAAKAFEEALEINPNHALAHNNFGVVLTRLGRYAEASTHYQAAIELNERDAEAHFNLANLLSPAFVDAAVAVGQPEVRQRDSARARRHYEEALRLAPRHVAAAVNLGNLELSEGDYLRALEHYQWAVRSDPSSALARFDLANALIKTGQTNEAIRCYEKLLELEPQNAEWHRLFAAALERSGRREQALPEFRKAVRLKPDDAQAQYQLALGLTRAQETRQALEHYREAIRLKPNWALPLNNLAWILATDTDPELRNGTEAVRLGELAAAQTDFKEPTVLSTLAAGYAEAGRFDEAIRTGQATYELAIRMGDKSLAETAQARLKLFQAGKPYRTSGTN